jgi:hypothetical protein
MRFVDDGMQDASFEEPKMNERLVHTKFGFDVRLERRDPYGFVYICWNHGNTPNAIAGSYTDFDKARQAVVTYLDTTGFNKVVEEKPVYEKAQYKKKFRNGT